MVLEGCGQWIFWIWSNHVPCWGVQVHRTIYHMQVVPVDSMAGSYGIINNTQISNLVPIGTKRGIYQISSSIKFVVRMGGTRRLAHQQTAPAPPLLFSSPFLSARDPRSLLLLSQLVSLPTSSLEARRHDHVEQGQGDATLTRRKHICRMTSAYTNYLIRMVLCANPSSSFLGAKTLSTFWPKTPTIFQPNKPPFHFGPIYIAHGAWTTVLFFCWPS